MLRDACRWLCAADRHHSTGVTILRALYSNLARHQCIAQLELEACPDCWRGFRIIALSRVFECVLEHGPPAHVNFALAG